MITFPTDPKRLMHGFVLCIVIHLSIQAKMDKPNAGNSESLQLGKSKDTSVSQFTENGSCRIDNFEDTAECIDDAVKPMMAMFVNRDEYQTAKLLSESINGFSLLSLTVVKVEELTKARSIVQAKLPDMMKLGYEMCKNFTQIATICSSTQKGIGDGDVLGLLKQCSVDRQFSSPNFFVGQMAMICGEDVLAMQREQSICLLDLYFDIANGVLEIMSENIKDEDETEPEQLMSNNNNSSVNVTSAAGNYSCFIDLAAGSSIFDEPTSDQTPESRKTGVCELMTKAMECMARHVSKCGGQKTVDTMRQIWEYAATMAYGPCGI